MHHTHTVWPALVRASLAAGLCLLAGACLRREVSTLGPTTKSTFVSPQRAAAIDKIDLLLAIDDSRSMKDKQNYLAEAVPVLVERLVTPNCVVLDDAGQPQPTGERAQLDEAGNGTCNQGSPEFKPITDIHIGILSSSLGNFGDNAQDAQCIDEFGNAHAELLNRFDANVATPNFAPGNFLAWYPDVDKNTEPHTAHDYLDRDELSLAFRSMVAGTGDTGCGLEAQLETVYQFLIAPDPWERIVVDGRNARYDGLNRKVLEQRRDFLRPDSLVAIVMLTDEDDSSVDPLSVGGEGHLFMRTDFFHDGTIAAPRARPICATDPGNPECDTCARGGCEEPTRYTEDEDPLNVRFFDMKRRFGVDPQYPIARYRRGLTSDTIPSRDAEHGGAGRYDAYDVNAGDCVNPLLYGDRLPGPDDELCLLPSSKRRAAGLLFFALVGGVPNELITEDKRKDGMLTNEAWTTILGSSPETYHDRHEDGKDWRMVQSITPRGDLRREGDDAPANDPLNTDSREWDTRGKDLQYACTFPLPSPSVETLDCDGRKEPTDAPLCSPGADNELRQQIRAKAYPTIRQAWLVRDLGPQGILTSLCPRVPVGDRNDPTYGYNPAVNEVVDRLRNALTAQCLPRPLERNPETGEVACLMLEVMPEEITSCDQVGRSLPSETEERRALEEIIARFREQRVKQAANEAEKERMRKAAICRLTQDTNATTVEQCQAGDGGWCYLEGTPGARCAQQVVFNDKALAAGKGSTIYLQCITNASETSP